MLAIYSRARHIYKNRKFILTYTQTHTQIHTPENINALFIDCMPHIINTTQMYNCRFSTQHTNYCGNAYIFALTHSLDANI